MFLTKEAIVGMLSDAPEARFCVRCYSRLTFSKDFYYCTNAYCTENGKKQYLIKTLAEILEEGQNACIGIAVGGGFIGQGITKVFKKMEAELDKLLES